MTTKKWCKIIETEEGQALFFTEYNEVDDTYGLNQMVYVDGNQYISKVCRPGIEGEFSAEDIEYYATPENAKRLFEHTRSILAEEEAA